MTLSYNQPPNKFPRCLPQMLLPIILTASPDEVYNFPLLISRAPMRYSISHYSYRDSAKCTTFH